MGARGGLSAYAVSVAISKILLYYRFTPIADPEAVRLWQRDLCELLGLRGTRLAELRDMGVV